MDILKRPSSFPMIALQYTDTADPYFEVLFMSALEMISVSPTMQSVFAKIKEAKPGYVPTTWPRLCNILVTPPIGREYQSGIKFSPDETGILQGSFMGAGGKQLYNQWKLGKPADGLKLKMEAKCQAEPAGKAPAGYNQAGTIKGIGSTCYLRFTNKEVMTKSGEALPTHITVAHELIHCLHYLNGESQWESKDEEHRTAGLKRFVDEPLSENKVRADLGVELRKKYFADD